MNYAVFFRNLNLGRPNCPTKAQFEAAFLEAGAAAAASFLTNGTIALALPAGAKPEQVLAAASSLMREQCGLKEPAYFRTLDYLRELVASDPFSAVDCTGTYECCISFLHPDVADLPGLPWKTPRADAEVFRFTGGEALGLTRQIGRSPGSPNALLEKRLGLPATTRNWNTVVRLVKKFG